MKRVAEIYAYREMISSLVRRELRGRYKGSVLGFLWTFLNPLLQLLVYTLVFSVIMNTGIENYYLFLFVALVPWIFFSNAIVTGSTCILANSDMVKKIYFPREVMPIANVTSGFVNMILCFLVVFAVLIVTGFGINPIALLFLPIIMIVEYILTLGFVLIFAALTVYIRDLSYILSILIMAWQFLTPVMYARDTVPKAVQPVFELNPVTSIIEAYRTILYYKEVPRIADLGTAVIVGVVFLLVGFLTFGKLQKGFAEEM